MPRAVAGVEWRVSSDAAAEVNRCRPACSLGVDSSILSVGPRAQHALPDLPFHLWLGPDGPGVVIVPLAAPGQQLKLLHFGNIHLYLLALPDAERTVKLEVTTNTTMSAKFDVAPR